jgi:hypothetical protein
MYIIIQPPPTSHIQHYLNVQIQSHRTDLYDDDDDNNDDDDNDDNGNNDDDHNDNDNGDDDDNIPVLIFHILTVKSLDDDARRVQEGSACRGSNDRDVTHFL